MSPTAWRGFTVTTYSCLLGMLVALELLALRRASAVPRFGSLVRWAFGHRATQLAVLLVWWWLGWHFILAT